jgi:hypothetical protein
MTNLSKKIVAIATSLSLVMMLVPADALALTADEIAAQIAALQAQLAQLNSQLNQTGGATCATFDTTLYFGMRGDKVKALQEFLISKGHLAAGLNTGYFGNLTKAAVSAYQTAKAITPAAGYFGPLTRAAANADCAAATPSPSPGTSPSPSPATGDFKVELASDNPASATLADGSAYNTMLKAKISAGSAERTITSVTIERTGLSVDTNVSGVLVSIGGKRYGNVVTLADKKATIGFTADPIKVAAGQSVVLDVQYHVAAAANSGTIGANLTAMSGAPSGLPLTGNLFTIADGANNLGTLTMDVVSLTTATVNVDIGQTDYYLTKFRFVAGANEHVQISQLVLFQNGTAADEDLKNWELIDPNGVVLATAEKAVGKVITFNLASPYVLNKGTQKDLQVRVDVISGSSRTAQAIIQNDYDVVAKGVSTGAGILPTAAAGVDAAIPIGDIATGNAGYNHLTVAAGTLTVNKAASSPSGTFGIGASNITVAIWDLEAKGEEVQIQRADLAIAGSSGANDFAGTVKLMTADGTVIYSVAAPTAETNALLDGDGAGLDQATFATYYSIPAGTSLKLKLVVDSSSTITGGETAQGQISDIYYKRMTSNTYATASAGTFVSGNTMTASAASLTVVNNAEYGATTVIEGQSEVLLGSYLFQTGSSQGVNVSSIQVDATVAGEAALAALSNMKLKKVEGSTLTQIGTTVASPTAANTFTVSGQLNIPANTTVKVNVYANMSTAASDGGTNDIYTTDMDASDVTGVGATSGTTVNAPAAGITGRAVTAVESGTLTVSIETSGAAATQFYSAGLAGVEMGRLKLAATVEDMKVQSLTLRTINGSGNLASVKLLGTGLTSDPSTPLTAGNAVFTFSTGGEITVPAYGSRVLTAVVDTTAAGTLAAGNMGVLGFGTADAIGAGSGLTTQERLTGTVYVAGTNAYSGDKGDVVYFTSTADAGTNTVAGFYMVTTDEDGVNLATGDLELNEGATQTSWTAGDIITKLTKAETVLGNANAVAAFNVGDLVYVFDSDDNEAGFAVVTTAVAAGAAISGLGFSPAGTVAIAADTDVVTKFTNSNGLAGNTMRYEEVEPVMTLASGSPSGSQSPQSEQSVAVFNVTASGYRDMTFRSLTLEKSGSNEPYRYVSKLSLYNGSTPIAAVANTTIAGVLNGDTLTPAVVAASLQFCTGAAGAVADEIGDITAAEYASLRVGDKVVFSDGTDEITGTIATKGALTSGPCGGALDTLDNVTFSSVSLTKGTANPSATPNIHNYMVHFDANQAQTGDTVLAEQTVTAGQTMALTVKANTASVRSGVTSGTVTFGVAIPGTAGPLNTPTVLDEGLEWDYTPLNTLTGAADYKSQADGYPVSANTLTY